MNVDFHDDLYHLVDSVGSTLLLAVCGWLFRTIRKYLRALRYAQEDISTIWDHLDLPRELRSGSYSYPRRATETDEEG